MRKLHGNDSLQRINYLYQISKNMTDKNPSLSSYYGNLMVSVGKKNVLKMSTSGYKKTGVQKCRCILADKVSAKMQLKTRNKKKFISWNCNTCGTKKEHPADQDSDHVLWLEQPEAVVEVVS